MTICAVTSCGYAVTPRATTPWSARRHDDPLAADDRLLRPLYPGYLHGQLFQAAQASRRLGKRGLPRYRSAHGLDVGRPSPGNDFSKRNDSRHNQPPRDLDQHAPQEARQSFARLAQCSRCKSPCRHVEKPRSADYGQVSDPAGGKSLRQQSPHNLQPFHT